MKPKTIWVVMSDLSERELVIKEISKFFPTELEIIIMRSEKEFMEQVAATEDAPEAVLAKMNLKYCSINDVQANPKIQIPFAVKNGGHERAGIRCLETFLAKFPKVFTILLSTYTDEYTRELSQGLNKTAKFDPFDTKFYLPKLAKVLKT